jgi:hypothetical protein
VSWRCRCAVRRVACEHGSRVGLAGDASSSCARGAATRH